MPTTIPTPTDMAYASLVLGSEVFRLTFFHQLYEGVNPEFAQQILEEMRRAETVMRYLQDLRDEMLAANTPKDETSDSTT